MAPSHGPLDHQPPCQNDEFFNIRHLRFSILTLRQVFFNHSRNFGPWEPLTALSFSNEGLTEPILCIHRVGATLACNRQDTQLAANKHHRQEQ